MTDAEYMRMALTEAQLAAAEDEVPVGAVVIRDGAMIARAHNAVRKDRDATAHAELIALREAMTLAGERLTGCTLYVTLEPCAMCMGAMVNAQLEKLVFGAFDARFGCCGSATDLSRGLGYNVRAVGGVLETECAGQLSDYFAGKRKE